MAIDALTLALTVLFCAGGIAATLMAVGSVAAEDAGHGEFHALLLASVLGMVVLAGATDLIALFIGFELLSIPLYVLCASELRRATSLESGLKYLIVGSVGSATLVYGLALVYGATGATGYDDDRRGDRRRRASTRTCCCSRGVALDAHRPGLQGVRRAVPPVDARRLRGRADAGHRVHGRRDQGGRVRRAAAALRRRADRRGGRRGRRSWPCSPTITIVVGNVGALGQSSLKRMLAYSSVAQAGYMLAGVVVSTQLGVAATVFYLVRLPADEPRGVRRHRRARARRPAAATTSPR